LEKKLTPYLLILALAVMIVLLAFPPLSEPLTVEARPSKLVVFNNTVDTLYYAIFSRGGLQFTSWEPCDHPWLCADRGIKPGLTRKVPYEIIYRWQPGAEVVVYWWRLEPDNMAENGYRLDGPYDVTVATPNRPLLGM